MNKKTIISLSVAAALIGVTVWYLRQLSVQLRLVEPDTTDPDELELLDEAVGVNGFIARHMPNLTPEEAKKIMDESREILAGVEAADRG